MDFFSLEAHGNISIAFLLLRVHGSVRGVYVCYLCLFRSLNLRIFLAYPKWYAAWNNSAYSVCS